MVHTKSKEEILQKFKQAIQFKNTGKLDESIKIFYELVQLEPNFLRAYEELGYLFKQKRQFAYAEQAYRSACILNASYHNLLDYADSLMKQSEFNQHKMRLAIDIFTKAFNKKPEDIRPLAYIVEILARANFHADAMLYAKKIYELEPDNEDAVYIYVNCLRREARTSEAIKLCEKFLAKNQNNIEIGLTLLSISKDIDKSLLNFLMEKFSLESDIDLKNNSAASPYFVIANYLQKKQDYDLAWQYYEKANDSKCKVLKELGEYRNISFTDIAQQVFTKSLIEKFSLKSSLDLKPIFILGMPRSGTTLVEQIISSHEQVYGIGETTYLSESLLINKMGDLISMKEELANFSSADYQKLADLYLNRVQLHLRDEKFFTDKMPDNYLFIALIKMIFPQAKIIHCRRNPIASCFSMYSKEFVGQHDYIYNMQSLIHCYKRYQSLMNYWHSLFPGEIFEVSYESLIQDQEKVTKDLIDYCGLSWDDACLNFHENARAISTSSMEQVNQKIYKGANDMWRNYDKYLVELKEAFPDWV